MISQKIITLVAEKTADQSYSLPGWIQLTVAWVSILSFIGVLIAIIAFIKSNKQFKDQLKLNQEQFKSQNQGWILFEPIFNVPGFDPNHITLNPHEAVGFSASIENVGNTAVEIRYLSCVLYHDQLMIHSASPQDLLALGRILIPKEKSIPSIITDKYFTHRLTDQELNDLKVNVNIVIEYNDLKDSVNVKKIDRTIQIHLDQPGIIRQIYTKSNDIY